MFKNVIVTAVRIAFKQKLITLLNVIGIALGIAVSIVLIVHVRYETSFDKHIPDVDRVFRITNGTNGSNQRAWATTSTAIFHEIPEFFPEIEQAVRIRPMNGLSLSFEKENGDVIRFEETGGFNADSTVFDLFGIKLIAGNPVDFYEDLSSLVITESMAERYFGDSNPIGKQLASGGNNNFLTVKGVMPDCPDNSHLNYTCFLPYKAFKNGMLNGGYTDLYYNKGWAGLYNYIKLKETASFEKVKDRMDDFTVHYYASMYDGTSNILEEQALRLQPVQDIHLRSNMEEEIQVNGNITYIYVFIISLIFILIVVGTNYVNLATSLALKRSKEIGIKKVNGSSRSMIRIQILSEAMITSIIGGLLAILLVDILLPSYNRLAELDFILKDIFSSVNLLIFIGITLGLGFLSGIYPALFITGGLLAILLVDILLPSYNRLAELDFILKDIFSSVNLLIFIGITLGLGFLSGIYPALFITRFDPVPALKGLKDPGSKANTIRKVLLIFQFVVSVFMIFVTIGIYTQMRYFQSKNLGFDKENLLSFSTSGATGNFIYNNSASFKEEINALPSVKSLAYCSNIPGERLSMEYLEVENHDPNSPNPSLRFIRVCQDYIETMGLNLTDGPGFTDPFPQTSKFILSKKAVEVLELENPVDEPGVSMFGGEGIIRGVIEDYHFASLHMPIEPVVLEYNRNERLRGWTSSVLIRLNPGNVKNQLSEIEGKVRELVPDAVINFKFVDDHLSTLYVSEIKMSKLFKGFTLFTILIACLGLFGITAYNAELRTKEIGIRKVMGASNSSLIKSLSVKFMTFIVISVVIALPLAYWFITSWMQNFTYRASLSVFSWILAVFLSLAIAYITIIYHAIKMANMNPADILKCE